MNRCTRYFNRQTRYIKKYIMTFDFSGVPKSRIFDLLSILIEIPSITINTAGISNQSLVYTLNNLEYQLMVTHFKNVGKILKNPVMPRSCRQKT